MVQLVKFENKKPKIIRKRRKHFVDVYIYNKLIDENDKYVRQKTEKSRAKLVRAINEKKKEQE